MKKTGLKETVKCFSVDFNPINTNDILGIHKSIFDEKKIMFWLIKKTFIGLLTFLGNGSNYTKCLTLINQKCIAQSTLINYILTNTAKIFTTLHLQIDVLEVVILLMTYLIR